MSVDVVFEQAVLFKHCQDDSILNTLDLSELDSVTLRALINKSTLLNLKLFPIRVSKSAIKCILKYVKTKYPDNFIMERIDPDLIQTEPTIDEIEMLQNDKTLNYKPNIVLMVAKNIGSDLFGSHLNSLQKDIESKINSIISKKNSDKKLKIDNVIVDEKEKNVVLNKINVISESQTFNSFNTKPHKNMIEQITENENSQKIKVLNDVTINRKRTYSQSSDKSDSSFTKKSKLYNNEYDDFAVHSNNNSVQFTTIADVHMEADGVASEPQTMAIDDDSEHRNEYFEDNTRSADDRHELSTNFDVVTKSNESVNKLDIIDTNRESIINDLSINLNDKTNNPSVVYDNPEVTMFNNEQKINELDINVNKILNHLNTNLNSDFAEEFENLVQVSENTKNTINLQKPSFEDTDVEDDVSVNGSVIYYDNESDETEF